MPILKDLLNNNHRGREKPYAQFFKRILGIKLGLRPFIVSSEFHKYEFQFKNSQIHINRNIIYLKNVTFIYINTNIAQILTRVNSESVWQTEF